VRIRIAKDSLGREAYTQRVLEIRESEASLLALSIPTGLALFAALVWLWDILEAWAFPLAHSPHMTCFLIKVFIFSFPLLIVRGMRGRSYLIDIAGQESPL